MISKLNTFYKKKAESYDQIMANARETIEKAAEPIVKEMALAIKIDCRSSEFGLMLMGRQETLRSAALQEFIDHMKDEFDISYHFTIIDGEFKWID